MDVHAPLSARVAPNRWGSPAHPPSHSFIPITALCSLNFHRQHVLNTFNFLNITYPSYTRLCDLSWRLSSHLSISSFCAAFRASADSHSSISVLKFCKCLLHSRCRLASSSSSSSLSTVFGWKTKRATSSELYVLITCFISSQIQYYVMDFEATVTRLSCKNEVALSHHIQGSMPMTGSNVPFREPEASGDTSVTHRI